MLETYEAVRNNIALFDQETDGRFRISGPDYGALNQLVSIDLNVLRPYHGSVSLVLDDDAGLIAIALIFKGSEEYYVFTEGERADALAARLAQGLSGKDVKIEDLRHSHCLQSVIGPSAQNLIVAAAGEELLGLPYLSFEHNQGLNATIFRVGFTGEFEYRFLAPLSEAEALRDRLSSLGQPFGLKIGNSEALSLLLLEVRSIKFRDAAAATNVLEAGLHWMVHFNKPGLVAGATLNAAKTSLKRRGLMLDFADTGMVKIGDALSIEGRRVGEITEVKYSPSLGRDIGFGYVDVEYGWVGISFEVESAAGTTRARGISAPTIMTRSIYTS